MKYFDLSCLRLKIYSRVIVVLLPFFSAKNEIILRKTRELYLKFKFWTLLDENGSLVKMRHAPKSLFSRRASSGYLVHRNISETQSCGLGIKIIYPVTIMIPSCLFSQSLKAPIDKLFPDKLLIS